MNTLGLRDFVTIGPPLYGAEKWAALRECGAFVFPARWDGLSVMVLEAAAARAPLVMTNTTLIARYLAGQHAAVLVDATVDALSTGILAGLSSAGAEVGSRAGRVVADRFSWPAVAEDYANQVASILRQ